MRGSLKNICDKTLGGRVKPSFVGKNLFPFALHLLAQCVLQQVAIQLENAKERLCIDKITTNISSKYFYLSNTLASYTVSKYRSSCQLYDFRPCVIIMLPRLVCTMFFRDLLGFAKSIHLLTLTHRGKYFNV